MTARPGIVLALASPALLDVTVGGVSLGDLAIVAAILLLSFSVISSGVPKLPTWVFVLPALLSVGVLSTLVASLDQDAASWFRIIPASTWLLRLAVVTLLVLLVAAVLPTNGEFAVRSLIAVATLVSVIAVLGWLLATFGSVPSWVDLVDYRAGFTAARAEGTFSEPARLGTYLALTLPWLVAVRHQRVLPLILASAAIFLTLSPTAIAVAGLVVLALAIAGLADRNWRRERPFVLGMLVIAVLGILLLPTSFQARELTVGRIESFIIGEERSGSIRVFGSWEPAMVALGERPLLGSSPGNMGRLALAEQPELGLQGFSVEAHSWNIFALVAGSLGILGALAVLLAFGRLSWTAPMAGVLVIGFSFASSDILHPTVWVLALIMQVQGTGVATEYGADSRKRVPAPRGPASEELAAHRGQRFPTRTPPKTR